MALSAVIKAVATTRKRPAPRPQAKLKPTARFRLRVTAGEAIAIGPGRIALLEAIDKTGSLTAAASSLGMSYRRAWLLLEGVNRSLMRPAVTSVKGGPHGGGSTLTDVGRRLIGLYRRIESEAMQNNARDIRAMLRLLAR